MCRIPGLRLLAGGSAISRPDVYCRDFSARRMLNALTGRARMADEQGSASGDTTTLLVRTAAAPQAVARNRTKHQTLTGINLAARTASEPRGGLPSVCAPAEGYRSLVHQAMMS